jgi:hypothetical protein
MLLLSMQFHGLFVHRRKSCASDRISRTFNAMCKVHFDQPFDAYILSCQVLIVHTAQLQSLHEVVVTCFKHSCTIVEMTCFQCVTLLYYCCGLIASQQCDDESMGCA